MKNQQIDGVIPIYIHPPTPPKKQKKTSLWGITKHTRMHANTDFGFLKSQHLYFFFLLHMETGFVCETPCPWLESACVGLCHPLNNHYVIKILTKTKPDNVLFCCFFYTKTYVSPYILCWAKYCYATFSNCDLEVRLTCALGTSSQYGEHLSQVIWKSPQGLEWT